MILYQYLEKAGFIYIDVDLYSSCKEVLNYLRPKLCVGTLIMFDDWYCFNAGESMGEKLALEEFCKENPNFEFESWKNFSTFFGKSFFVKNMTKNIALITGVSGQDGSYLAEILLEKKYQVVGLIRRSSLIEKKRIDHLRGNEMFKLEYGDMTDSSSISSILSKYKPTEIYNLAAT